MIEPRVYRAAFLPALIAVLVAMFSLESRPPPLAQGLPADVLFDGEVAAVTASRIARESPDRRPGTRGDRAVAALVASTFAELGFRVERDSFEHHGRELVNVVARRAGRSRRLLVVLAGRDARRLEDAGGSASDTAALLELARVLAGRPTRETLVLASVDGSTLGEVGAERLAGALGGPERVVAVLVMSDLGATSRRGSLLVPWSSDTRRAGIGLERTAAASIREETDQRVGGTGPLRQLARLAFPIGIGAQGPLLERGFDSLRISGSGELPHGDPSRVDESRLGVLGRASLRTLTALDRGGPPERGPRTYVTIASRVLAGWLVALLAATLLLPALVASVDALARARRRREPVSRWARWLATWLAAPLAALATVQLLALVGATPDPPPAASPPADFPLDLGALVVIAVALGAGGLAWWLARRLALRPEPALADPSAAGAGCALALASACTVLLVLLLNPFAALVLVASAHLWMLATLGPSLGRRQRLAFVALGALPVLLVALLLLIALELNPLAGAWYLLVLLTGGAVGLGTALLGCLWLALLAAAVSAARAQRPPEPGRSESTPRPALHGPGTHAGPGSLGGTESALR